MISTFARFLLNTVCQNWSHQTSVKSSSSNYGSNSGRYDSSSCGILQKIPATFCRVSRASPGRYDF